MSAGGYIDGAASRSSRCFANEDLSRSHVWWPGLDKNLEEMAAGYQACQSAKQAPAAAPLHPWIWPTEPWQRVHADFAGPIQGKMYFIAVDAHSKWPEVVGLPLHKQLLYCVVGLLPMGCMSRSSQTMDHSSYQQSSSNSFRQMG